ncbi:hypothetical protein HJG60_012008 [Phyllostomus discolor]|uniref:Uncharacterized protein n=1 Tax=Phyllostomus discolor TaxID=89673 RepID=A0A833ZEH0_9CHIR|nr:hypothetical protein HJG60_012008 [Phyllostomus discolor]
MKPPAHSSGQAHLEQSASAPCQQSVLWSRAKLRLLWGPPSSKSNSSHGPPLARSLPRDDCWGLGWPKQVRISEEGTQPLAGIPSAYSQSCSPGPRVTRAEDGPLCSVQENGISSSLCSTDY